MAAEATSGRGGAHTGGAHTERAGVVSSATGATLREAVAAYRERRRLSGAPEPWMLVEQLGDALLDEVLTACAEGLVAAADDAAESLVADEFRMVGP